MISLKIDGRSVEVQPGVTLLEAAARAGIEIPTLCHLEGQPASASCYLCVVRVQGRARLSPSCATLAEDGMVVESETDEVRDARRTAIELLLSDHLGDCVAPCQGTCPASIDIPAMIRHIAAGNPRKALEVVKESVALPGVLGHICPELCEKGCRRKAKDEAVAICNLKRYVAEADLEAEEPYLPPMKPDSGKKVAIVGGGPAGLSAAYYLRRMGHACTVFDDHEKAGGLLRTAQTVKPLPMEVLDGEIAIIAKMGVVFELGKRVGRDLSAADLQSRFDAVLLTVGDLAGFESPWPHVERSSGGLRVDPETMLTNLPGVFAAGSAVTPAKHAVRAVADGRRVAERINRYLAGTPAELSSKEFRCQVGRLDQETIQPFMTVATAEGRIDASVTGYLAEQARREAGRCIQCGCVRPEGCRLRRFAGEYGASQPRSRGDRREFSQDATHPDVIFEPGKCIACGICVRIAAAAGEKLGMGFVGRGFSVRTSVPFGESVREGLRETARECAEKCPTGALILREWLEDGP